MPIENVVCYYFVLCYLTPTNLKLISSPTDFLKKNVFFLGIQELSSWNNIMSYFNFMKSDLSPYPQSRPDSYQDRERVIELRIVKFILNNRTIVNPYYL